MEKLRELERRFLGEPQEQRVKVLLLLKEDPSRTAAEIADALGCSERSVRRWWGTYAKEGLNAYLELSGGGEADGVTSVDQKGLELLGRMIARDEFGGIEEVRDWLLKELGMRISRSELQYVIHVRLGIDPPWDDMKKASASGVSFDEGDLEKNALIIPSQFLHFLNVLPLSDDAGAWSRSFRDALLILFKDVDHIAVNINQTCNLTDPGSYRPTMIFRQHNVPAPARGGGRKVVLTSHDDEGRPSERVMDEFRMQGRPLHRYHPPVAFDYYYAGYAYLGSLFLFRDRESRPISEETINTIDALEPFIIHALANHVMWYLRNKPAEQVFQDGLHQMVADAKLSAQEQRVVVYHLMGYSYEEMADLLSISAKTVKKHVNTIHHKTGTRRQRELFARYFSPRIGFSPSTEGG